MERDAALGLMRRAVEVGIDQWPETADRYMEVPLDYFVDPASTEIIIPDDFPPTRGVEAAPWWRQVEGASWRQPEGPHSGIDGRMDQAALRRVLARDGCRSGRAERWRTHHRRQATQ